MKRFMFAGLALAFCGIWVVVREAPGTQPADGRFTPVLRTGMVPIGALGHPLGTYLTLEGKRATGPKTGLRTLHVEKIDGVAPDTPVYIWVDNLDLPSDQTCIVKGYETVRMIGQAPAIEEAAKEHGRTVSAPQAGWQIQTYFVALRAVAPAGLKIDPRN